jgi:hypothetical protein
LSSNFCVLKNINIVIGCYELQGNIQFNFKSRRYNLPPCP